MEEKFEEIKDKIENLDDKYWLIIYASILVIPIIIVLIDYLVERVKKSNQYKKMNEEQGKEFKDKIKKMKNNYNLSPEGKQQDYFQQQMFNLNLNSNGVRKIGNIFNASK